MRRLFVAQQRPQGSFLFRTFRCIRQILSLSSYKRVVFLARDPAFQLDQLHVHAATAVSNICFYIVLFLIVSSDESKGRAKPGFFAPY